MPKGIPLTDYQKSRIIYLLEVEHLNIDVVIERLGIKKLTIISFMKQLRGNSWRDT